MAVNEIWKGSAHGLTPGSGEFVNSFYFKMKSASDPADTIGAFLRDEFINNYKAVCTTDLSWDRIECRRLSLPPIGSDFVTSFPIAGAGTAVCKDYRAAGVVTLRTASLGRSYRGRLYLPAPDPDQYTQGQFQSGWISGVGTIFDDILAAVGVGGSNTDLLWGVWSRVLGEVYTSDPALEGGKRLTGYNLAAGFQPITGIQVQKNVATQRRRGFGVRIRD